MPTISDVIAIKLAVDASGLVQGQQTALQEMGGAKRTLQQQGAELEQIAKAVGYGLEKVITGVAGFFALVLSWEGFKQLTVDAAQAGTSMGRFAESIGKTVEETQAYRQAFAAFTGGTTNILQTIQRMKIDLSAAPLKYTPWMTAVERLTSQTVRGKEPEQILQEVSAAAARRNMTSAQVISWLEGSLPLSAEDVLLLSKPGGLQEAIEAQRRDVGTPTMLQAKAMERLHADITNVETTGKLLELQALTLMEPFLHELLTMTLGLLHWMRGAVQMLGLPSEFSFVSTANAAEAGGGIGGFGRGVGPFGFGTGRGYSGDVRSGGGQNVQGGGGQGGYSASGREQLGVEAEDLSWVKRMQDVGPSSLIEDRKKYAEAMNDPVTREAVMARMESEVGNQDRETQQGWLETTLNRASSRYSSLSPGAALRAAVSGADGYFGSSQPRVPSEYVKSGFSNMLAGVGSGSNIAKYGTGNWSGREGHGFGQSRGGYQTYGGTIGGQAQLNDENGKTIDAGTMKEVEVLGRAGNVEGLQQLFASRGYRMSGPACGIVASAYARSAGFKPPPSGAIATEWHKFGVPMNPEDINKAAEHPFGSMFGTYFHRRYGGSGSELLGVGETGGHVMTIVPGSYDPVTRTVGVVDQYGYRKRSVDDIDFRFAGAEAVKAVKARSYTPVPNFGAATAAQSFDDNRPKIENNENSTHINQVTVHTHATDATGIAKDVKDAIGKQLEASSKPWPLERLEATP